MIEKIFKNKKRFAMGFTLIEMVVVIAVVAILMSIVAIRIGRGPTSQAYDTRRMSDLQKVQTYLELYYTKNRQYPTAYTWDGLRQSLTGAGIGIDNIPNDPLFNSSAGSTYYYSYCVSNDYQDYILGAMLSAASNATLNELSEIDNNNIDNTRFSGCGVGSAGCDDPVYCIKP